VLNNLKYGSFQYTQQKKGMVTRKHDTQNSDMCMGRHNL
jgi:hypothetical protein